MNAAANEVVITGIGIVTSLGIGRRAHQALLSSAALSPVIDIETLQPYPIRPLPEIDWNEQIPRRSDQRQMENWQRLGVFAAGLALDDAGLKDDLEACAEMDLIVAAGGGERDIAVDTLIIEEGRKTDDRELLLNQKLTTELRPTLFLAQLSNLLAGNISIVHKVTGSSRSLMGEESAGVSAFEIAWARIAAGQSNHCLVGGAYIAERPDLLVMVEALNLAARLGPEAKKGIVPGTAGAFLLLESREHAESRGATIYAVLDSVAGDRGKREGDAFEARLAHLADTVSEDDGAVDLVISGAAGEPSIAGRERAFLENRFPDAAWRSQASAFGHGFEAQFPLALALASIAVSDDAPLARFEAEGDADMKGASRSAIVTALGMKRGEGMARLSRITE